MEINIEPNKGWNTDNSFVPPGFHIASEMIDEGKKSKGEAGDQPYAYPMGVGGMIMNGCFGTNYQAGDPCYEARRKTTICTVSNTTLYAVRISDETQGEWVRDPCLSTGVRLRV